MTDRGLGITAKRIVRRPARDDSGLPATLHPVLRRVLATRGVVSPAQIEYSLQRLSSYQALSGIEAAVRLLVDAVETRKRILVVADFDADGATSCALAVRGLRALGAYEVGYVVPNRFEYGYGLTPEIVTVAARHAPDLLVTVDNGISSMAGVAEARRHGIRVLITDHHLPGGELPKADAIVNPKLPGDQFPSKNLAGVGVMFYVLLALRARLRSIGWFGKQGVPEPKLAQFLDLVALGTVADVVPLDYNNRILVAQGMVRIRARHCQAGIRALVKVAGKDLARFTASDLGFVLAPRLNAAGRLTDMSLGIECLLSDNDRVAESIARQLDALNRERREIEGEMLEQAAAELSRLELDEGGDLPFGLCLYKEKWHQGVIGILASRIKERVQRPVIALAPAGNGELKGSARSIPGLHIRDVLEAVATRHPSLITKFGGHVGAAGVSVRSEDLPAFKLAFDQEVRRHLLPADLCGTIYSDGELLSAELGLDLAETLRSAGPWGHDFPEPLFDGKFKLLARRTVAKKHLKLVLQHTAGVHPIDAIAFNRCDDDWLDSIDYIRVAYRLSVNEFQGIKRIQLVLEHIEPTEILEWGAVDE